MTLVEAVAARAGRERAEWEALLRRRDLGPRVRERLEMVKAAALGQGVSASRGGRPAKAGAAYLAALEAAVEAAPPTLGLPFDVWTSDRLSAYLADTTGV